MPKTTCAKTLTLTALALSTFFTTLTPATATDNSQAIEQLTQTGPSVAYCLRFSHRRQTHLQIMGIRERIRRPRTRITNKNTRTRQ